MKKLLLCLSVFVLFVTFAAPASAQIGFGGAAEINGNEVFVGEPNNRATSGYVYVYRPEAGGWVEAAALTASDASEGDGFGTAILADGDSLMISAVTPDRSIIYLYARLDGEWTEVGTLGPQGSQDGAGFGSAMDRDGEWLIVGASGAEESWGAAYLYQWENDGWRQATRLIGERGEIGDYASAEAAAAEAEGGEAEEIAAPSPERFGAAVAIENGWAFVGAPTSYQNAGRVYVFRIDENGIWDRFTTYDYSVPGDRFGASMALESGLLAIGAPFYQPLGAVRRFVYDDEAEDWIRDASAFPFEGMAYQFGAAIQIQDSALYIASIQHLDSGGIIYVYNMDDGYNFTSIDKIGVAGYVNGDALGASFAMAGDTMVLGAPGDDGGAGTTAILDRSYGGWNATKVVSEAKGLDAITGETVECAGGFADRFGCDNVDLLAFLPTREIGGERGTLTNDVWGWTDPETERDYALIGLSIATSFVDVTDPHNPVYIGRLMRTAGAPDSAWRDIKIHADHAFIVSDSAPEHGIQIFDLERLREYDGEPIEFTEVAHYDQISAAHNIVINESSAMAFVVGASAGGETCGGGLHMVNIEDPRNPSFAGCFTDTNTGRAGTGYSHDAQCIIYNGPDEQYRGHEICFGSNETALSIADVTDRRNPEALGMATYPNVAYAHQGWITDDHKYFYMNDEGDELSGLTEGTRTLIWDVQELEDPILVGAYVADNQAVDHNLYIKGDTMYQSNYDSGLRVFDISDRENPRPIAYFDTVPFGEDGGGMMGTWSNYPYFDSGVVVVTSMGEGVFLVRVRDAAGR